MTFTKRIISKKTDRRMITLTENAKLKAVLMSALLAMYAADSFTDFFGSMRFILYIATGIWLIVFLYYISVRHSYTVEKDDEMSSAHRTKAASICLGILGAAASVIFLAFQIFDLRFTINRDNIINVFMFAFCIRSIIENVAFLVLEKNVSGEADEEE